MLSSNSCGEVYEIAGKLISIRLPQNNKNTITRCGAPLKNTMDLYNNIKFFPFRSFKYKDTAWENTT